MLQARLLQVFDATEERRQQRFSEQVVLAVNRSDYMLDEPSSTLLQVPFTITRTPKAHSISVAPMTVDVSSFETSLTPRAVRDAAGC